MKLSIANNPTNKFKYDKDSSVSVTLRWINLNAYGSDFEICKAMFIDWSGIENENGESIPVTPESIKVLMSSKEGFDFIIWCIGKATMIDNFEDNQDLEKN